MTVRASLEVARAQLRLVFDLDGALEALAIPKASRAAARRDRLWEHTCFEAFIGPAGGSSYLEVNLSPSGDWAVWAFDAYREGMRPADHVAEVSARVSREDASLRLEAELPLPRLDAWRGTMLRAGLAAVLEEARGSTSFWACAHPSPSPDFHARDGWPILVYAPASA